MVKKFNISKKQKIILGSVLAAVLVMLVVAAVYFVQSDWSRSTKQLGDNKQSAQQAIDSFTSGDSNLSVDDLKSIQAEFAKVSEHDCSVKWWQQWRLKLSDEARQHKSDCETLQANSKNAAESVTNLTGYLEYDKQAATVLDSASSSLAKVKYTDYDKSTKIWNTASDSLKAIDSSNDTAKSQTDQLVTKISAIQAAYDDLKKADKKQNMSNYDKSVTKLDKTYKALKDQKSEASKTYSQLVSPVVEALNKF